MKGRIWLPLPLLAAGLALLVAASFANARGQPPVKNGGIFRFGAAISSRLVDPQLGYDPIAWWLSYATGAKLYNYPDKAGVPGMRLVPEVASRVAVSNNGKRYVFTIRRGFRFSDGTAVTAGSFKYAIERVANHDLASPGADFITDPNGTDIVGAEAALEGKTTKVSGVVAKGDRLIINLTKPDPTFMAKITMPFFQATSRKLPLDRQVREISSITDMPTAGPYAYALNEINRLTVIRRNPWWRRGPGRNRPRHLDGVRLEWNLNPQTAFQQLLANELDTAPVPAAEGPGLARKYGVNKSRFWVKPIDCTGWLVPNTSRPLFHNVKLRKALNYAVNRKDYIAVLGSYAGKPWSHILSPGVPGSPNVQPYPLRTPNLAKAKKLAGSLGNKKINVWYVSSGFYFPGAIDQFQIVRRDLMRLGFRPENINATGFDGLRIFVAMGNKGNDADLGVSMGWCSDYPDPYDWINILFYGGFIRESGNLNYSQFDVPKWNRRMEAAARLVGPERFRAYGQLDLDLMRQAAPIVPMANINQTFMFSKRVDPRSLAWQRIYAFWSIPALALK
ncbi:MAG TPA: ABC transporter substrate-binding protein [Gaiellaceae bacterium]|nr:ABC transporter substrate-binding protein [Gaiellaceae bacterium]